MLVKPRPFLRYPGGKTKMLKDIKPLVLKSFSGEGFHEPCLGGGAMLFSLAAEKQFKRASAGDVNANIVCAYKVLRDQPDDLIARLREHDAKHAEDMAVPDRPNDERYYYRVRSTYLSPASDVERAALVIYLSNACFNGLWRESSAGQFNVAIGDLKNPAICNEPLLRACSAALQNVDLYAGDFGKVESRAAEGDAVYFDPPYAPLTPTAKFTSFTARGFGLHDHHRMRNLAGRLKAAGVHVVISNSAAPVVFGIYEGFEVTLVQGSSAIAGRGTSRGKIAEVVIT